MDISTRLKHIMKEKKVSINELEKYPGVRVSSVQNIIYGRSRNPGIDTIKAIAKALNCNVGDLLGNELNTRTSGENSVICDDREWKIDLYINVLQSLKESIDKNNITMMEREGIEFTKEIYNYTIHSNKNSVDKNFVNWIIDRKTRNI